MKYKYEITTHPADAFESVVYFCNDQGDCNLQGIPTDQLEALGEILNKRGEDGWELIQVLPGRDGFVAFWKSVIELSDN